MYKRFLSEESFDKAYSCAKRLKKGHLLWWLAKEQPWLTVDYKANKPVILEIVTGYLNAKFNSPFNSPMNQPAKTEPEGGEKKEPGTEDPLKKYNGEWDNGPTSLKKWED
jgi:hypothetical protein